MSLASEYDSLATKAGTIDIYKLSQQFSFLFEMYRLVKKELNKQEELRK